MANTVATGGGLVNLAVPFDRSSAAPHSGSAGMTKPRTVGELRQTGYAPRSVKTEIRQNLIRKLERGEQIFPGIVGYDETVLPQIENALLSGQDVILLGERGQAKSRLARALVALLDETVPALAGSEVNDDPLAADQQGRPRAGRGAGRPRARWSGCRASAATARSSPRRTSPSPT